MVSVVVAGGGTAGHTSPLIATVAALRVAEPGIQVSAIGTPKGLETTVVPAAGIELDLVDPVPLPRRPSPELLRVPLRLRAAVAQARAILVARHADVLVGFGGYVSMPAYLAARRLGLPVIIHEQNAVPGLANKVAARFARRTLVSFPGTPLPGAEFIGMPLRPALVDLAERGRGAVRAEAASRLGLDPGRPTLLVSGGSQGARSINTAVAGAREALLAQGVQILHVIGPRNIRASDVEVADPATGARYIPLGFVDRMEDAYAAADLMLGRSGAGTVVETAVVGLPAILVPLPHGNGEQARNADPLVRAGSVVLIPDADLTAERLVAEVGSSIHDPERLAARARAGQHLMPATAARALAAIVLDTVAESGVAVSHTPVHPSDDPGPKDDHGTA
ncbi:MAG TPA: undecaprenyldiphospho-muramoylpentapeptide beta-N-acetylglucosaminyltransferase [Propionibacteriaceae bacterium]|nr:undecaprenyldiphospho-muramoylpentapeptide beta-N-acetylglucosaminyltransferase [Propionibacteriaceae bacterium]